MKHLKNYTSFYESLIVSNSYDEFISFEIDLNESLNLFYKDILSSIGTEVDLFKTFKLVKKDFENKTDLDLLSENIIFINSLSSIGLRKSSIQSTSDLETFVNIPCRFFMVYRIEANDLENPDYILFQAKKMKDTSDYEEDTFDGWEKTKLYRITGDINHFYNKLSSKVIEIIDDGKSYIYQSSNKNEWELQNVDKETDKFKKYFRKSEFEKFIKNNNFTYNII